MSSDASAAAASPMTNGASQVGSHREADASSSTADTPLLRDVCADLHRRVTNFLDSKPKDDITKRTQEQTRISTQVIEKALRDYDFDALSLSYNGGKDCLVLLIIYLAVLHTHFQPQPTFPTSIPSIYAKPPDPFPSVTAFVEQSSADYHLNLTHISTNPGTKPNPSKAKSHSSPPLPNSLLSTADSNDSHAQNQIVTFRDAFALYLQTNRSVRAIFVGTRRTDPHGAHLTHFDQTDGNWPSFMRVHPVIDWHLSEIWCFLRSSDIASERDKAEGRDHVRYCRMYDEGYTSLGGVGDTVRNPRLRDSVVDREGGEVEIWRPAWMMGVDEEERLGRE